MGASIHSFLICIPCSLFHIQWTGLRATTDEPQLKANAKSSAL
jgi:hypothetical protein